MRSLKKDWVIVEGCKMIPGRMYLLEFPNRIEWSEYIFEFDSVDIWNDGGKFFRINHRNKWISNGMVHICRHVNGLVTLPCGEDIKLSRYRKHIDWDNI